MLFLQIKYQIRLGFYTAISSASGNLSRAWKIVIESLNVSWYLDEW